MKTPREVLEDIGYEHRPSLVALIEARDAQHAAESQAWEKVLRAELDTCKLDRAAWMRAADGNAKIINQLTDERDRLKGELAEARRLIVTARNHLSSAADIIMEDGGDEDDDRCERKFIQELDVFLGAIKPHAFVAPARSGQGCIAVVDDKTGKTCGEWNEHPVHLVRPCLAHLPSDDGGWNDATRRNYERDYGEGPPCTCPAAPSSAESPGVRCPPWCSYNSSEHPGACAPANSIGDPAAPPDDIRDRQIIEQHVHCRGCGHVLRDNRRNVADGCICNSGRGINHGIVPRETCTCTICDPAQTGSARPKDTSVTKPAAPQEQAGHAKTEKDWLHKFVRGPWDAGLGHYLCRECRWPDGKGPHTGAKL